MVPASLLCSLHFLSVETKPDGYLVGKELVILLFVCVVGKSWVVFYVFSFPPGVYVGTLDLIASNTGPSFLNLMYTMTKTTTQFPEFPVRQPCIQLYFIFSHT